MDASFFRRRGLVAIAAACASALGASAICATSAFAASDPFLADQWALGGGPGAIGVAGAWAVSHGAGVVVAVVDSGVQVDHPDLRGALWTNPQEIAGNGVDDDADGIVDDVHGANLLTGSGDVSDDVGHGTAVAGIIAARAGNDEGIAGVAPQAQLMVVKVKDAAGHGDVHTLAAGIRYAVDEGARIVNVSVNSDLLTADLQDAITYATQRGATIVASAGNDGRDLASAPSYPVSLQDDAILGVTACDPAGMPWALGNFGAGTVDLCAPGTDVMSLGLGGGYEDLTGTSEAAPQVAGALALLAAARPDLSQSALRAALLRSARRAPGVAGRVGAGLLDVGAAMRLIRPDSTTSTAGRAADARLLLRAARTQAGHRATLHWSAVGADDVRRWRVSLDGHVVAVVGRTARVLRKRVVRPGDHRWRVVGLDAAGNRVVTGRRIFKASAGR
jgi:subtilisin family serine protease